MKNEDDSASTSVRSENGCYNKEDGWERYYDENNKSHYFYKTVKKYFWELDPENPRPIAQKLISPIVRKVTIANLHRLLSHPIKYM